MGRDEVNGYDLGANETITPVDPPEDTSGDEDNNGDDK